MKPFIFISRDEYEGDEELYAFHTLYGGLLYSIELADGLDLTVNFYKNLADFYAKATIGTVWLRLDTSNKYDEEHNT